MPGEQAGWFDQGWSQLRSRIGPRRFRRLLLVKPTRTPKLQEKRLSCGLEIWIPFVFLSWSSTGNLKQDLVTLARGGCQTVQKRTADEKSHQTEPACVRQESQAETPAVDVPGVESSYAVTP